jgi:hypothetical protein
MNLNGRVSLEFLRPLGLNVIDVFLKRIGASETIEGAEGDWGGRARDWAGWTGEWTRWTGEELQDGGARHRTDDSARGRDVFFLPVAMRCGYLQRKRDGGHACRRSRDT